MTEVTHYRGPANSGSLRVEDLLFLNDFRALGVPWIDKLIDHCTSTDDVERVWTLIRSWGPDYEDAEDVLHLSAQMPRLGHEALKILRMIRICENYRS
jgi:hypothetical protein